MAVWNFFSDGGSAKGSSFGWIIVIKYNSFTRNMESHLMNIRFLALNCLCLTLIASVASNTYFGYASSDNGTSIESARLKTLTSTNDTNIVLFIEQEVTDLLGAK